MKLEPLSYCYQEDMMTPAISLHSQQHPLYTAQDIFASQQYVYPSLPTTHFCTGTTAAVDSSFPAAASTWSTAQPTTATVSPAYTSMTYEATVSMGSAGSPTPSPCENTNNSCMNNPLTPPTSGDILNKDSTVVIHHSPSRSPASDCQEAATTSASFPTLPIQSLSGSIHLPGVCVHAFVHACILMRVHACMYFFVQRLKCTFSFFAESPVSDSHSPGNKYSHRYNGER